MSYQLAFHFTLLVDTLNEGNYASAWKTRVVEAFLAFKKDVADARQHHRESREAVPHYDRFARLLSGSGSDTAEIIRQRHGFLLGEVYPKLNLVQRDSIRLFDPLEREVIYNRDRGQCQHPDHPLPDRRVPFGQATIHHIVEHTVGGTTTLKNGVLVCPTCHANRARMQELAQFFKDYIARVYSDSTRSANEVSADLSEQEVGDEVNGGGAGRLRIVVDWGALDIDKPTETIFGRNDAATILEFLRLLIGAFGKPMTDQLTEIPVIRYPLSPEPEVAFVNRAQNEPYTYMQVPGTNLFFCPQSSRRQKVERLKALVSRLTLPDGDEFPADSIKIALDDQGE